MIKALLLTGIIGLAGCASAPSAPPQVLRDDVGRLLAHPQFKAAAQAAPDFTREALETTTRLDHELNLPR